MGWDLKVIQYMIKVNACVYIVTKEKCILYYVGGVYD